MPYIKTTKRQQDKVLKTVLSFKKPYKDTFAITPKFYDDCGFSLDIVESCLNALSSQDIIDISPPCSGSYPVITIKAKAFNYFPDENDKNFKYWVPIICSNIISVVALIVAVLTYIKQ